MNVVRTGRKPTFTKQGTRPNEIEFTQERKLLFIISKPLSDTLRYTFTK